MKKMFKFSMNFVFFLIFILVFGGCGGPNINKIESIIYKDFGGNQKTLYSWYMYNVEKIEICDKYKGEVIKDITKECAEQHFFSREMLQEKIVYEFSTPPFGYDDAYYVADRYYPYVFSDEFNCEVSFKIYLSDVVENYDLEVKDNNGMIIISYFDINTKDSHLRLAKVNKKTISVFQESVIINYY